MEQGQLNWERLGNEFLEMLKKAYGKLPYTVSASLHDTKLSREGGNVEYQCSEHSEQWCICWIMTDEGRIFVHELRLAKTNVHESIKQELNMRNMCAKLVPNNSFSWSEETSCTNEPQNVQSFDKRTPFDERSEHRRKIIGVWVRFWDIKIKCWMIHGIIT